MMCSTKPLVIHLIRGAVGLILIIAAVWLAQSLPLVALLLGVGALVAFRGCPTCWIAGLFEVISRKKETPQEVLSPDWGKVRKTLLTQQGLTKQGSKQCKKI